MAKSTISVGLIGVASACLLAGCAPSVNWTPTQPSPRPMNPRPVESVEVFNDQAPQRPHIQVGVITGEKKRTSSSDARGKLTETMRKKAAKLGCDALLVREVSPPPIEGSKKAPPLSLEGGCLMWSDAAPVAAAPPPSPAASGTAQPPPATDAGCANDMQCKGNRICENGQCVSPPSAETTGADAGAAGTGAKCKTDVDCPGDDVCMNGACTKP